LKKGFFTRGNPWEQKAARRVTSEKTEKKTILMKKGGKGSLIVWSDYEGREIRASSGTRGGSLSPEGVWESSKSSKRQVGVGAHRDVGEGSLNSPTGWIIKIEGLG